MRELLQVLKAEAAVFIFTVSKAHDFLFLVMTVPAASPMLNASHKGEHRRFVSVC